MESTQTRVKSNQNQAQPDTKLLKPACLKWAIPTETSPQHVQQCKRRGKLAHRASVSVTFQNVLSRAPMCSGKTESPATSGHTPPQQTRPTWPEQSVSRVPGISALCDVSLLEEPLRPHQLVWANHSLTNGVSMASWAPPNRVKPSATTSTLQQSAAFLPGPGHGRECFWSP